MKKTRLLAFLFALLFVICSCGPQTPGGVDDAETEPDATSTTLKLGETGAFAYTIIRADEQDTTYANLTKGLKKHLSEIFSSSVNIDSDFVYAAKPLDETAPELIIGDSNRVQTAKLKSELEKAGGYRYGIYSDDCKVAVYGSDITATWLGVKKLLSDYIKKDETGKQTFEVPANLLYVSDALEPVLFDFESAAAEGLNLAFYCGESVAKVPTTGDYGTMQGGGTDGTYAYYAMINSATLQGIIYKYDLKTWQLVKTSSPLKTAHSNDITYDSKNKRLVLSYCHANDNYTGVCFVDAETLELQSYTTTTYSHRAVEYLPETNQYFFAANYVYTLADENLNKISAFNDATPTFTTQGMCCDGKYIYDVRWESGEKVQHIDVHTLGGQSYGMIPFYESSGEPENIFKIGAEFYIGCNKTDSVYRVQLLPENWFGE